MIIHDDDPDQPQLTKEQRNKLIEDIEAAGVWWDSLIASTFTQKDIKDYGKDEE